MTRRKIRMAAYALNGILLLTTVLAASPVYASEGEVRANGLSFHYLDEGTGPPLVLIHGSIGDYREWSKQIGPFSQSYRVVAYSRRYHWPNSPAAKDSDATLDRQVDDLEAIIRTLGIAPAHVIGHSYGGATAILLALRRPELVRTLVLVEAPVGGVLGTEGREGTLAQEGQTVRAEMKQAFSSGNAERIVTTYASRVAPGEFEKASPDTRQMLFANISAFALEFQSSRPPFTCDDARKIRTPSLVVSGGRSAMGLQRISEVLAQCLQAGHRVKIPEATHWLQSDHAKTFNDAALDFLGRH
jgi:non-heme chloroperoxidase